MVKEIESDMAEQLAKVNEWEANGKPSPIQNFLDQSL
jgi:hypothetical protein